MIGGSIKNQNGTSLMELIVALALFTVVILTSSGIFQSIVNSQRSAIASQDVQENMRYALEVMSKEIRTAKKDKAGDCVDVPEGIIYETKTGDDLFFKNQYGECVAYSLVEEGGINRIQIVRGESDPAFITPNEINIKNLVFIVDNTGQASVVLMMEVESLQYSKYSRDMKIQTTISSRYYE